MTLGLLLVAAALGLSVYNLADDRRAGEESAFVVDQLTENVAVEVDEPGVVQQVLVESQGIPAETPMPTEVVDSSLYIGTLRIPSLGLELPVMDSWSYDNLRIAPCRYAGSAYSDDLVIAAHSYASHFGSLRSVKYGAEVSFIDVRGNVFVYEVASVEELKPGEVERMVNSEWELTLFTCTFDGSERVTVRCVEKIPEALGYNERS